MPPTLQGEGKKEMKKDTKLGLATSKADNFSEWYTELVRGKRGRGGGGLRQGIRTWGSMAVTHAAPILVPNEKEATLTLMPSPLGRLL